MSLSGIAFDSVYAALATAYAQNRAAVRSSAPARVAAVHKVAEIIPIRASGTALATSLGTLIGTLSSGDIDAARAALTGLSKQLNAQPQAAADASALSTLLPRLGLALHNGNPTQALTQINAFLLNSQSASGTGFSAKG